MIPTLYAENETQFQTNGLGRLSDAISCVIKQNNEGVYELEMEYPLDGIHAEEITNNRIIYAKPERGKENQPFKIRNIEKNLNGRMKITARHNCYDLNYYACAQFGQTDVLPYQVTPKLYDDNQNPIGLLTNTRTFLVYRQDNNWVLFMQYPSTGAYYSRIVVNNYIEMQPEIGYGLAMLRITTVQTESTIKTITATAEISPSPYIPTTGNSMTVEQAISLINTRTRQIQTCPFTFSVDPVTDGDAWIRAAKEFTHDIPKPVKPLLQGSEGSIVDVFGGEWEFDHYNCILHESRGSDNGVQYRYGKNITGISERINIDEIYTHAFSFWKGTASSSTDTEQGEYYVKSGEVLSILASGYSAMFPSRRTLIIDASSEFEEEPTTEELNAYTRKYAADNSSGTPTVTIEVSIIDLANTMEYEDIAELEQVNLYDTVTVVFPKLGINEKSKVTEIEFDVLNEKNNKVTIGDVTTSLSNIIAGNKRDIVKAKYDLKKWADKAMERATECLAGWKGGNIRKNYNKNDHKQQSMYIMNTDDVDTASNAVMFNENGIAVSGNGARGNYLYMVGFSGSYIPSEQASGAKTAAKGAKANTRAADDDSGLWFSDKFASEGDTNGSFLKRGTISSGSNWWNLESDTATFDNLQTLTVTGLLRSLSQLNANLLDVSNKLTAKDADVSNKLTAKDADITGTLKMNGTVYAGVNDITTNLRGLNSFVTSTTNAFSVIQGAISGIQSDISGIQSDISGIQSNISGINGTLDDHEDRIKKLEKKS